MRKLMICIAVLLCLLMAPNAMATPVMSGPDEVAQKSLPVFLSVPSVLFMETTEAGTGANGTPVDQLVFEPPTIFGDGSYECGFDWVVQSSDACVREISWSDFYGVEGGSTSGAIISSSDLDIRINGTPINSNPYALLSCQPLGESAETVQLYLPWTWGMKAGSYVGSVTLVLRQT